MVIGEWRLVGARLLIVEVFILSSYRRRPVSIVSSLLDPVQQRDDGEEFRWAPACAGVTKVYFVR
jgi:hypothetical protein